MAPLTELLAFLQTVSVSLTCPSKGRKMGCGPHQARDYYDANFGHQVVVLQGMFYREVSLCTDQKQMM